jgi:NAD(P)-dependent dehydrogenase (short-subunit alcohol dehydrogenase family)
MNQTSRKVAIITGGSQGIGASLVAAYCRQGWGVVATARTMKPTEVPDVLTVDGILFLEASPYITGEILHIDGGQIAGH